MAASAMKLMLLVLTAWVFAAGSARAADKWHEATVELSDGRTVKGKISVPGEQLFVYNEQQKKRYSLQISAIQKLETVVEKESLEKHWFFKEGGSDEKVYTGDTFPVRYFITRVSFQDGQRLEGHIIAKSFYLENAGGERERLTLLRKAEGKVGQKLDDLIYVKSITLSPGAESAVGTIKGTLRLPAGEKVRDLKAMHRQDDVILDGQLSAGGGFRFAQCTAGTYDLLVVSDKTIYAYFSLEKEEGSARLSADVLKEIQDWAARVRDFFHARNPIYGAGSTDKAYVLVRQERYGGTAYAGAELVRRYEVWLVSKPAEEWQIGKRFFVSRELTGDRNDPRERLVIAPQLGGHVLSSKHPNLSLELDLTSLKEAAASAQPEKEPAKDGK